MAMSIGCQALRACWLGRTLTQRENTYEQTLASLVDAGADAGARRLLRRRLVRRARRNRPELRPQPAADGVPAARGHRRGPARQCVRLVEFGYGDERPRVRVRPSRNARR